MSINQLDSSRATEAANRTSFEIDPSHTMAEFAVKHMMISTVKGRFAKLAGTIELDEVNPLRSSVEASADIASIDTRDEQRDAHLRSADFFDAETHPQMTLRSKRMQAGRHEGEYKLTADLSIRGVTREVVFDVSYLGRATDPWGNSRIGLNAAATINRKDFGLQWNVGLEAGGVLVGESVKINLEIEGIKK